MARVYTKKPDAKREKVTVPVTSDLHARLVNYAAVLGVSKTSAARAFIEAGLDRAK